MADPKIKYDIEANVAGDADVAALSARLQDMAGVLDGPLRTKALAASAALDDLGNKQLAVDSFVALKNEATAAAARLDEVQLQAQALGRAMSQSGVPTRAQVGQMQKLRDAVGAAKIEMLQSTRAVEISRAALAAYGISASSLAGAQRAIRESTVNVRREFESLIPAYEKAGQAAQSSGARQVIANKDIGQSLESINGSLDGIRKIAGVYLGVTQAFAAFKGISATADEFQNLEARVKLATGEGADFTTTFASVVDIAKRTSSELTQTGTLFTRLTEAGKSAGLSTEDAVQRALGLTETINQAVQLSGGSVESSQAAVTQLIQGLQSGVLRGEEFNSVMEQAPRLAKALADGLGRTTGELRAMANAGELTADTVIKALQGQSEALKNEFGSLPATVGRALTNLSTNWTVYIGEVDKANGISALAAKAIDGLANNLEFLGAGLLAISKATAAFIALRLAQNFTSISTAAKIAAIDVAASGTAISTAGKEGAAAAVGIGRFASILSSLKTFALLGILTNLPEIGKALGEGAAKLMGYKDRTDELAAADKYLAERSAETARSIQNVAAASEAAAAAQFGLTKRASSAVNQFDALRKSGDSAAEALGKIGKDFDPSNAKGIADMAATLDNLITTGKIGAAEFQAEWAKALAGKDLQAFEVTARSAFSGTAREAERLAQLLDITTREAIKRAGLDFDLISTGMGKAARSAINDAQTIADNLDGLAAKGVDTGRALTQSLGKAIDTADGQRAIDAVRSQIERVRLALGDRVADGLLEQAAAKARALGDELTRVTPGINGLREAMSTLGLKNRDDLIATANTAQQAYGVIMAAGQQEGESYVAWQARKQAAAEALLARQLEASGGIATDAVRATAAMAGLELQTDAAGKTIVRAMASGQQSVAALGAQVQVTTADMVQQAKVLDEINSRYGQGNADREGKYGRPSGGSVLTKDTMQAVDNTGLFSLQQKRAAGTLSTDDLATAEAALQAATTNLDQYQKNSTVSSLAGAESIMATFIEARAIVDLLRSQAAATAASNAKNVTVNLAVNGSNSGPIPTTEAGARALVAALKKSKTAAGY
jgi:tape measure domain-containing protein